MSSSQQSRPGLRQPIFVVGSPRSGTTLVQCILSASRDTFSLPETHFFSTVLPVLGLGPLDPFGPDQVPGARMVLEQQAALGLEQARWSEAEQGAARGGWLALDLFQLVVEAYRPPQDGDRCLRLVEKTPLHVLHLDQIGDALPDARFVQVVREPVDVVSSWMQTPFADGRSLLSYAEAWTRAVAAADSYAERWPERLHTVRYETLIAEPKRTVAELCAFLELPYEERLLLEFGQQAPRNVGHEETWKQDVQRGVLLQRDGVWRERMTPGQAWLVQRATSSARARHNYPGLAEVPAWSALAALLGEMVVRFHEGRKVSSLGSAIRHAGTPLKALQPTRNAGP